MSAPVKPTRAQIRKHWRSRKDPYPRKQALRAIQKLLPDFAGRHIPKSAVQLLVILEHWPVIVGPRMSERCCPTLVKGSVLFVEVRDHQWAHDLRYMSGTILERIAAKLEGRDILAMRFRIVAPDRFVSHAQRAAARQQKVQRWPEMDWPTLRAPSLAPATPPSTKARIDQIQDPSLQRAAQLLRASLSSGGEPPA